MNVLIINLCQMGDLVQATPFFHDLRSRGARVTLLVRKDQEEVSRHLPDIDRIIPIDLNILRANVKTDSWNRIEEAYGTLQKQLEPLFQETFDVLYNMTHTRVGALLSEVITARDKKGILIPDSKNRWTSGRAIRYLQQTLSTREFNNIHVVDLHRTLLETPLEQGRLAFNVKAQESGEAEQLLKQYNIGTKDLVIGMQAGANEVRKRWPSSYYAELASGILREREARILLFGVESEHSLTCEIAAVSKEQIVNLTGKTELGLLAALLRRCRVLISNDTGTSHLAAAVGTPQLSLHFGHVDYRETGPYGEGHVAVQVRTDCCPCSLRVPCDHFKCREALSPTAVHHALRYMLDGALIPDLPVFENLDFVVSAFDALNFLNHRPLLPRPWNLEDWLRETYGTVWKRYLTDNTAHENAQPLNGIQRSTQGAERQKIKDFLNDMDTLYEIFRETQRITGEVVELSRRPEKRGETGRMAKRFKSLHQKILATGSQNPRLRPLTSFYEIEQENIRASNLTEVMKAFEAVLESSCNILKNMEKTARSLTSSTPEKSAVF